MACRLLCASLALLAAHHFGAHAIQGDETHLRDFSDAPPHLRALGLRRGTLTKVLSTPFMKKIGLDDTVKRKGEPSEQGLVKQDCDCEGANGGTSDKQKDQQSQLPAKDEEARQRRLQKQKEEDEEARQRRLQKQKEEDEQDRQRRLQRQKEEDEEDRQRRLQRQKEEDEEDRQRRLQKQQQYEKEDRLQKQREREEEDRLQKRQEKEVEDRQNQLREQQQSEKDRQNQLREQQQSEKDRQNQLQEQQQQSEKEEDQRREEQRQRDIAEKARQDSLKVQPDPRCNWANSQIPQVEKVNKESRKATKLLEDLISESKDDGFKTQDFESDWANDLRMAYIGAESVQVIYDPVHAKVCDEERDCKSNVCGALVDPKVRLDRAISDAKGVLWSKVECGKAWDLEGAKKFNYERDKGTCRNYA